MIKGTPSGHHVLVKAGAATLLVAVLILGWFVIKRLAHKPSPVLGFAAPSHVAAFAVLLAFGVSTAACRASTSDPLATNRRAAVTFSPAGGQHLSGYAKLEEIATGVHVRIVLRGAPAGKHGIHVEQSGDCRAVATSTLAAHLNPTNRVHGFPSDVMHHLGDLGNVEVHENGQGALELDTVSGNLRPGDPMSLLDRALVIDDGEDRGADSDGTARALACGIIRAS